MSCAFGSNRRRFRFSLGLAAFAGMACLTALGCGGTGPAPVAAPPPPMFAPGPPPVAVPGPPAAAPGPPTLAPAAPGAVSPELPTPPALPVPPEPPLPGAGASSPPVGNAPAANAPPTEQVVAGAGVGLKGRSLDPHEGILVTPAKAFFAAKERIVFDIQIPEALKLYKALEGSAPKSHEEFLEKIVTPNSIKLPVLPPGHKYVFNPETETLMVERPQQ